MNAMLPAPCDPSSAAAVRGVETPHPGWTLVATILASSLAFIDGSVINVRCRSHSLTNGKIRRVKHYTAETIDLLAVYDVTSDRCYYIHARELGTGRSTLNLRLKPSKNGQRVGTRPAENYLKP